MIVPSLLYFDNKIDNIKQFPVKTTYGHCDYKAFLANLPNPQRLFFVQKAPRVSRLTLA